METKPQFKRPVKTHGYKSAKLRARRAKRYQEAVARQLAHDTLSIADKIKKSKKRGGSKRELKRLEEIKQKAA